MKLFCPVCERDYGICKADLVFFTKQKNECLQCFVRIGKDRYPVNIPGATTLFTPLGTALGDRIVKGVVLKYYKSKNPDEKVIEAADWDEYNKLKNTADKIMWCDVQNKQNPPTDQYYFSLVNEFQYLGKIGIYPDPINSIKPKNIFVKHFIALHLRNVSGGTKDATVGFIETIKEAIGPHIPVIMVGNDKRIADEGLYFSDYRNELTINEIAWILENCLFFIGKDSGIAHLAAAMGARGVVADYADSRWIPTGPGDIKGFLKKDFNKFVDELKKEVHHAKSRTQGSSYIPNEKRLQIV